MKFSPYGVVGLVLLVLGFGLVMHGAEALNRRNAQDRIYDRVLDALAQDDMAEAHSLAREFIASAPDDDPRLRQVANFTHEAAAREAVRLARAGDIERAERLLSALDDLGRDDQPPRRAGGS
jgi:hypothetical protein